MPQPSPQVQGYMDRPVDDLLDELVVYREAATGGAERGPADAWDKLVPALRRRVCDEWNWCRRRQDARFDEPLTLAAALAQVVAPDAMAWQVPAALIAVILVKKGLDAFCKCPPMGSKDA